MTEFLPFALPDIGEAEIEEVADCLRSGWLTTGPRVRKFEQEFANYVAAPHALAVNSATSGLHLALEAVGVNSGMKVVTSVNTFTATAEVMRYLDADPLFVDIDPESMNMDIDAVERALESSSGVGAILPVHFAGQACDMQRLCALADRHGLRVVEDAAHALPATDNGSLIGNIGDATVFSFYATKTLATGEGGMVTTRHENLATRMRTMRLHGISKDVFDRYSSRKPSWYYEVVAPGFKYNMPDMAAAIGLHQLRRLESMQVRRQAIAERYDAAFDRLPVKLPRQLRSSDRHAWHLYVIQLELEELTIGRDRFIELLAAEGIGTSVHFIPLHLQPYWRDRYDLSPQDFPVASSVFERVVSLPIYSRMSDADVDRVIDVVSSTLNSSAR